MEKLFNELKKLNVQHITRQKTFMEVSGYPHYENVVSNILAFLFDDSEEHGLKNLWVNSILSLVGKDDTSNVTVEREVYTGKGNRIDLLITTDDYVICIENKIYADLYNDLQDYKDTTYGRIGQNDKKDAVFIVLSLNKVEGNISGFSNVLYSELFDAVRPHWGQYISECNNTWLMYIKDFMLTIESLYGGNTMNTQFEELYRDNYKEIKDLEGMKRDYIAELKKEVASLKDITLSLISNEYPEGPYFEIGTYSSGVEMRASVYIDFAYGKTDSRTITIETSRDSWGWHIALYPRKGINDNDIKQVIAALKNKKEERHPAQKEGEKWFYEWQYIIENCDSSASLDAVAKKIFDTYLELLEVIYRNDSVSFP